MWRTRTLRCALDLLLKVALVTMPACAGSTRIADLNRLGVCVRVEGGGWYRLRAEEGYAFAMPGLPLAIREDFYFGGVQVPEQFFDLSLEANTRGFLVRVFDARELEPEARERLRIEALDMFLPPRGQIHDRQTIVVGGVDVERIVAEGYSGYTHLGILYSFVRGGFVFQMLVIADPESGAPTDAEAFLRSALRAPVRAGGCASGSSAVAAPRGSGRHGAPGAPSQGSTARADRNRGRQTANRER